MSYVYDLLGRVSQETRVIGTNGYVTAYDYDVARNVVNVTYPSGRIVFFDRDDDGKIGVIRTLPPVGSMQWLVQWVGRTPFGPRSAAAVRFLHSREFVSRQDGRLAPVAASMARCRACLG